MNIVFKHFCNEVLCQCRRDIPNKTPKERKNKKKGNIHEVTCFLRANCSILFMLMLEILESRSILKIIDLPYFIIDKDSCPTDLVSVSCTFFN